MNKELDGKSGKPAVRKTNGSVDGRAVKQSRLMTILMISVIVLLLGLVGVRGYLFYKDETELLIPEITIEAGTVRPDAEMFFKQTPKIPEMRRSLSSLLETDGQNIGITATSGEGLTEAGKGNAISVLAVLTVDCS